MDRTWEFPGLVYRLAVWGLPSGDRSSGMFLDWEWVESQRKFGAIGRGGL